MLITVRCDCAAAERVCAGTASRVRRSGSGALGPEMVNSEILPVGHY